MVLVLCLTLLPTAAFAEGEDVSISGGVIGGGETGGEGGGIYVAPGSPTEGGGGTYIPGEDTRTEIWCVSKPDSIGRSYDGTTDGGTIPIDLTFTDGTNEIKLKEGTGFTAKKTFDSADAGWHTVTVEIALIGEAAVKYKLKAGEETFTIGGNINKSYPNLTVSLSKTACTAGEKLLPLLSVSGAPEDAAVTYYYTQYQTIAGDSDYEGTESMPKIDENTAISDPGTYYVYAKTAETKNYKEDRSATVELTVNEAVVGAASVTKADGTDGGTYESLPAALDAAQDGDTVKLLANHTTDWSDVEAGEYATLAVVKKTLTLDLNGWTIDYLEVGEVVPDEEGGILESIDGNLTVVESSQGTTGKIIDLNFIKGTLDIQGGAIGADPSSTEGNSGQLTCNGNSGSVTIGGGTVYGVTVGEGASVIVSGGSMHEGNWFNDGTLTITGGTFDSVWFCNNGGTIAIRGGTFGEITNENASGKIPVMSLLADGYAFYGKDADEKYTVLQDSRETTLENVKVMDHTDHAFLNGACIACGALTCDKSNNGEEGGCIAHAVWSPWADDPTWGTTHIKTLDELRKKITDGGTYWSEMNPDAANATVTFLSDVTVDKRFLIDKYFAQIFLDLNGHTLSGELQEPIITANFSAGNPIINGTIENTGTGEAIRLEWGRVTLENVNVTGDMAIAYQYVNGSMYTAPFLGGGSFTRICPAANDVGGTWSKKLKDMLGTGCCFLDSAGSRIDAEQWFGSGGYSEIKELIDVRVKACDHKDENGSYTLFEDATMSYGSLAKRCKICGNLCPHDEITGDQNPACVACGLPIVIKTTNLLGGKDIGPWYYTGLNDAMHEILHVNKGRRPTLELLADTKSDSSYEWLTNDYDGIFIDLAGHTLTLTGDQNKASYWVTIQNTSDTHAEVRGTVNVYHKDNRSKLVILDTDNDLTIEEVKFVGDGTAQFAGGSFGKITVPAGKTLASLLVSGYYFADSNSATDEPAALYDTAGKALTVLTKVTVKPCSHDEAIYVPVDGGAWKCFCGQKTFVASVTKDDTTTLYTDLQEAFKAADGGTVELMANMVDVTVNTEKPFIFDLNGHSIHKLTVNSKITLKDSSEGEGKIVENLIVEAEGLTVGDLLEEGYAFRSCKAAENSNYTGSKSADWTVRPLKITASGANVVKTYDGTADLPANASITFKSVDSMYTGVAFGLSKGTDYQLLDARYDSPNAGEEKTISFTIKLKNEGYVFEDGTKEKAFTLKGSETDKTFKINKATIASDPQLHQTVFNDLAKTYKIDLKQFLDTILPEGCKYGDIQYGKPSVFMDSDYYPVGGATIGDGKLSLSINKAASVKQGDEIGTVTVKVETTNYQPFTLTIHVIAQDKFAPVMDGTISASEITYGQALADSKLTVNGTMQDPTTRDAVNGTFAWTDDTIKPDANDSYEAEWTFTPDAPEYATVTGKATVKVNKATPTFTAPTAQENLTYTGQEQALITAGSVMDYGTMQYSLTENGTYSQDIPTGTDAGKYTVWYRVIGDENHNDTAPASVAVRIGQKPLTITGVTAASKPYDGTTDAGIPSVTFDNVTLNRGTDYTVIASFDDASVGSGKNVTATVTLMGQAAKNYALEQSSFPTTGSITKAAAPDFTKETALVIINGHEKTYTVTLPALPTLETPKEYGALTYEIGEIKLNDGYYTSGAKVENGELTLPIQKNDVETTGSVGTVTVVIKSANYEDITLTVNVNATNKLVPTVTAPTANALTYNGAEQALITAGKTTGGTMLYRLGDSEWSEHIPTAKNAGEYTVWYKVQGDAEYADVAEQSLTVTVAKKAVTVTALDKSTYTGSTAPDLSSPEADKNYKVEGLVGADTLSGTVTLTYEQTPDMSKPGKTAINIAGTLSNDNYEITYVPGTLTVSDRSSSGGGGSYIPSYTVSADKTENGTITVSPKSAYKGDTVTFTVKPDKGYEPDTIKVLDQNGDKVKLTEKDGKYTFKMPDSKVEIQATFVKEAEISPFGDVSTDAYYYEAVKWAQKKGITGGIGNDLFGPNQPCTRAQIATFLWRAAGSPEPKNMSSFSDVPTDSYYAKAVAWAVENGITTGTGDGKFSPNAPCTRAQSVTFLYRASGSPAVSDSAVFADVETNAFYADAVAWAVANGVTNGTTSSTFSPDNGCTRAQIVTFLYRAFNK